MDRRKVIYYSDELNDEFSTAQISPKPIDVNWVYCHNSLFKKFTRIFWYRIIATPIAFIYSKLVFRHKIIGKEKLRPFKDKGYFIYGNHTQDTGDAFMPPLITFPKSNYCIVHPNNVSMPFLGRITPSLGAIPLPDDIAAYKNFIAAIERRIDERHCVVIYPEAHIWPYYTGIRNFGDVSFGYPVRLKAPVFCFTNTYKKSKLSKRPKIVTYIDGPFYPDEALSIRKQREDLRNRVHKCMCGRAKNSDLEYIRYIKRDKQNG